MSEDKRANHSVLTPLTFLRRNATVFARKIAVRHGEKSFTYQEFGERVNRLARALLAMGLEKGDRVAFLCPNIPPMLEAHFGVNLAGGVLVSINIRLSAGEIEYILNHSGSAFLFVDTELAHLISPIRENLKSLRHIVNIADTDAGEPLPGEDYESLLDRSSGDPVPWVVEDENEMICINYTSGTTGRPKGVMYSHRGAYLLTLSKAIVLDSGSNCVFLWTVPMFHCNGWAGTWAVTALGGVHVCLREFDPGEVWRLIEQEKVTNFNGAPVVMNALMNHPGRPKKLKQKIGEFLG